MLQLFLFIFFQLFFLKKEYLTQFLQRFRAFWEQFYYICKWIFVPIIKIYNEDI